MKPLLLASGIGLLVFGIWLTITQGVSLVPVLFVVAGCGVLTSPARTDERRPGRTLLPAILVFAAFGAMGANAAAASDGPWIAIDSLAALICFGCAALAAYGWFRIRNRKGD